MDQLTSVIVVVLLWLVLEGLVAEIAHQNKEPEKHKRSLAVLQIVATCVLIAMGLIVRFARVERYLI